MKVEFYQDDHGRIWLFNASEIWIRTIRKDNLLLKAAARTGASLAMESLGMNNDEINNENFGEQI